MSAQDAARPVAGLAVRFENAVGTLDRALAATQGLIEETREEITRAQASLGQDFPHREALDAARTRRSEIAAKMKAAATADEQAKPAKPTTTPAAAAAPNSDVLHSLEALASMHTNRGAPTGKPTAATASQPYAPPAPDRDTSPGLD